MGAQPRQIATTCNIYEASIQGYQPKKGAMLDREEWKKIDREVLVRLTQDDKLMILQ